MDTYDRRKIFAGIILGALIIIGMIVEAMQDKTLRKGLGYLGMAVAGLLMLIGLWTAYAFARDNGQWVNSDPEIREWYKSLMQPDNPTVSCCGEADAYWCDDIHVKDGNAFCAITDDRLDAPLGRPHRDNGTQYEIPPNKMKFSEIDPQRSKRSNPTGHSIIFLSTSDYVWCFVQGSGT